MARLTSFRPIRFIAIAARLLIVLGVLAPESGTSQGRKPAPVQMARLASLVGEWDVEFESRRGPNDTPTVLRATSSISSIFNSVFLQERGSMPTPSGQRIELLGLLGFDQFRSIYRFAWLDDTYALFDVHEGNWEAGSLVVSNTRTRTTLVIGGREYFSRMVWSAIEPDGFVVESFASTDGGTTWFVQVKARYTRHKR